MFKGGNVGAVQKKASSTVHNLGSLSEKEQKWTGKKPMEGDAAILEKNEAFSDSSQGERQTSDKSYRNVSLGQYREDFSNK